VGRRARPSGNARGPREWRAPSFPATRPARSPNVSPVNLSTTGIGLLFVIHFPATYSFELRTASFIVIVLLSLIITAKEGFYFSFPAQGDHFFACRPSPAGPRCRSNHDPLRLRGAGPCSASTSVETDVIPSMYRHSFRLSSVEKPCFRRNISPAGRPPRCSRKSASDGGWTGALRDVVREPATWYTKRVTFCFTCSPGAGPPAVSPREPFPSAEEPIAPRSSSHEVDDSVVWSARCCSSIVRGFSAAGRSRRGERRRFPLGHRVVRRCHEENRSDSEPRTPLPGMKTRSVGTKTSSKINVLSRRPPPTPFRSRTFLPPLSFVVALTAEDERKPRGVDRHGTWRPRSRPLRGNPRSASR